MEQVKLLSMTAVLTVLIWAGADSLVNEAVSVRVFLEVEPLDNPDLLIEVDPDTPSRWVEVQVSGPRKIVEGAQDREPLEARLRLADRPTGRTTVVLDREMLERALVEEWNEFRRLSIVSIQPTTLPIHVDHMITRELAITAQRLTLAYDEEPQLKQMFATVRMRETRFEELPRPALRSQLDISTEVERLPRSERTGQPVSVLVPLDSHMFGPGAELSPDRIEVTATIRADRRTEEIPTVPIKLAVSFANLAKPYQAVARVGAALTPVTQTIKVTGSADGVARLLQGETRAFGFIQLKEADLEELGVLKAWTPEYYLPPDIGLAEPAETIEFKLIDTTGIEPNG